MHTMNDTLKEDLLKFPYEFHPELHARVHAATVTEPEPTDAELLNALHRELGDGWEVHSSGFKGYFLAGYGRGYGNHHTLAALRAHGPAKIADALRLLAGETEA